jgi:hypothetical protein
MVVTAVGGVLAGVLIFLVVLALAGPRSAKQSQKATFRVGPAKRLAPEVDRNGPLLFQDLLNRSRDIYVQHVGGADWRAFEAHAPGEARSCVLRWRATDRRFVDPCSPQTFPADGAGLTSYATRVDKNGEVVVNLDQPNPAPTTLTAPSTTTSIATTTTTSTTTAGVPTTTPPPG